MTAVKNNFGKKQTPPSIEFVVAEFVNKNFCVLRKMFNKRVSASTSSKGRQAAYSQGASSSKGISKGTHSAAASPESPETGIVIPHIKTQDNAKLLPKYTAALSRSKDDHLPAEDLDAIQFELEMLLTNVAMRYRVLKSEYESLDKDDKRDRRKIVEKQPTSPGKRKRVDDKKTKERTLPQFKVTKPKNSTAHSPAQSQHTDDSMDAVPHHQLHPHQKEHTKPAVVKNDIPHKFWLSVEPYCMPITNEDLKLLDDLLEQYSGPLVPPIPELGPHYTTTWAADELKEEQDNANAGSKSKSKGSNSEAQALAKKGEKLMGEGVTGPLTQRLVSALMEENVVNENFSNADSNSSSENSVNSAHNLRSMAMMKNGISIEKRVKKELIDQGILEPDDGQEDEILAEIKRVLAELSAIAEFNSSELRNLRSLAKVELQRLEIKRKLDAVDHQIIEAYQKAASAKQKKRNLTSEEQDEIYRLAAEQTRLSDQLESIGLPGPALED